MSKSVRLAEYLYAEVERLAKVEHRSLANMVRVLLEQALKSEAVLAEREEARLPESGRAATVDDSRSASTEPTIQDRRNVDSEWLAKRTGKKK